MTIKDIIKQLKAVSELHGEETEVFFDCPKCNESFYPTTIVKKAIHISGKK